MMEVGWAGGSQHRKSHVLVTVVECQAGLSFNQYQHYEPWKNPSSWPICDQATAKGCQQDDNIHR